MSAATYNIELNQGADFSVGLLFKDSVGNVIPLDGASFESHIRADTETKIIFGKFTCSKDADTPGRLVLSMMSSETSVLSFGTAYYDLLMTKDGVKTRLIQGTVILSKAITK